MEIGIGTNTIKPIPSEVVFNMDDNPLQSPGETGDYTEAYVLSQERMED
jgi:hypothetical protein